MATSSTEATPHQGSEQPSLMQAGFKRFLFYTICSGFYTFECLFGPLLSFNPCKFTSVLRRKPRSEITTSSYLALDLYKISEFWCFVSGVNLGEACGRMCFPWIIAYLLAYKIPKSFKIFTWIFLATVFIEGLVTVIFAVWAMVDMYAVFTLRFFYIVKIIFWGVTTLFMIPIGMIVLLCVQRYKKRQGSALEEYEEI